MSIEKNIKPGQKDKIIDLHCTNLQCIFFICGDTTAVFFIFLFRFAIEVDVLSSTYIVSGFCTFKGFN